ncbi:hypothetical protein KCA24_31565, partial [Escherichia coli]|nr:hypothetical protein [Escherichia coli]
YMDFCGKPGSEGLVLTFLGERGRRPGAGKGIRELWKKWVPDFGMPQNYTGPQRWQKLNG